MVGVVCICRGPAAGKSDQQCHTWHSSYKWSFHLYSSERYQSGASIRDLLTERYTSNDSSVCNVTENGVEMLLGIGFKAGIRMPS